MTASEIGAAALWFVAIVALIPAALWLLKRTPAGAGATQGPLRHVAALALSPSQKVVMVEVGRGDARRWLVLGVTGQSIATLHEMAPQEDAGVERVAAPFAQLLARLTPRSAA
jgi:flagellar protein FliO/FliZ